jgi:Xaa-Pro aminopeptidase
LDIMTTLYTDRLTALRDHLATLGLDGYLIPKADEHQGEYIAARSERLTWLTGFTGSAGMAVVTSDVAMLFVDGRYTLQARQQVPGAAWQHGHIVDTPPLDWAASHLPPGARLGFDPWLLTMVQAERLVERCAKTGVLAVPVDGNLIDALWGDQPAAPDALVEVHPLEFAGRTSANKRAELAEGLRGAHCDAAVLTQPDGIAWLLNVRGADVPQMPVALSFALLYADGRVDWFVSSTKVPAEVQAHLGDEVTVRPPQDLSAALAALGVQAAKVRVDASCTASWIADRLVSAGAVLDRGADPTALPRARKNSAELDGARAAHRRDAVAMVRFLRWLEQTAPGGTLDELTVAARLEAFRAEGALFRGLAFDTISGVGPNGAVVHYRATPQTNRPLRLGDLILVDSGGQYRDGTTDVTRTVPVGAPDDAMRRAFTLVLKGNIALGTARFPDGTTGSQLDPLARQYLWRAGLDYDHGTGHGVGSYLGVHEGPARISKVPNNVALQPGMILSNEPGYYRTDAWGIRIETLVAVTVVEDMGDGARRFLQFETLTLVPIDRRMMDMALLMPDEIAWLDGYHARIWTEIGPLLADDADRRWLQAATAPLAASST